MASPSSTTYGAAKKLATINIIDVGENATPATDVFLCLGYASGLGLVPTRIAFVLLCTANESAIEVENAIASLLKVSRAKVPPLTTEKATYVAANSKAVIFRLAGVYTAGAKVPQANFTTVQLVTDSRTTFMVEATTAEVTAMTYSAANLQVEKITVLAISPSTSKKAASLCHTATGVY